VAVNAAKRTVPAIPREAFPMPDGGEVFVRALRITERLQLRREVAALGPKGSDEALEYTVPRLLGRTVVDEGGAAVFTVDEWCDYSATYPGTVLELFNKASVLSGLSPGDAEKNSEASRS
jgi:hypothetical protein